MNSRMGLRKLFNNENFQVTVDKIWGLKVILFSQINYLVGSIVLRLGELNLFLCSKGDFLNKTVMFLWYSSNYMFNAWLVNLDMSSQSFH